VSISPTLYTRIFPTKVLFSSYVLAKKALSYEKRAWKMLMKLTTGVFIGQVGRSVVGETDCTKLLAFGLCTNGLTLGLNFTNILRAAFLYESILPRFTMLIFWVL